MNQFFVLTPGYISGLTQTDGSFFCSIITSAKHRFGLQFRPKFTITADLDSKFVLDEIKAHLKCGIVSINVKNHTAEYQVDKLEDLANIIIPHFLNYPVYCAKLHAFKLFNQIVVALYRKEKRTIEGRRELLKMALSMNIASNRKQERIDLLYSLLDVYDSKDKELIINTYNEINPPITPNFISGVIDGDGSFYISFNSDGSIKTGFNITNDKESKPLLEAIKSYFKNIGSIHEGTKNELVYTVTGLNQITEVIIPFMDVNPIYSERALHYSKFRLTSLTLKNEKPLTLESKLKIVELCYDMNKQGKRRSLTKSQFINLLTKNNK